VKRANRRERQKKKRIVCGKEFDKSYQCEFVREPRKVNSLSNLPVCSSSLGGKSNHHGHAVTGWKFLHKETFAHSSAYGNKKEKLRKNFF
jgi:hypothetical protein